MPFPNLFRSKHFRLGYGCVVALFVAANVYDYWRSDWGGCDDCIYTAGMPFEWYAWGGFVTTETVLLPGFFGNVLLAHVTGLVFGIVLKFLREPRRMP